MSCCCYCCFCSLVKCKLISFIIPHVYLWITSDRPAQRKHLMRKQSRISNRKINYTCELSSQQFKNTYIHTHTHGIRFIVRFESSTIRTQTEPNKWIMNALTSFMDQQQNERWNYGSIEILIMMLAIKNS